MVCLRGVRYIQLRYLVAIISISLCSAADFEDFEVKCEDGQSISGIKSIWDDDSEKRSTTFQCLDMFEKDTLSNIKCSFRSPLQCSPEPEGCNENEWLAGVRVLDLGAAVPLTFPYCCSAENVETDCPEKPSLLNFKNRDYTVALPGNKVVQAIRCSLVVQRQSKDISDIIMRVSKCTYMVDGTDPPQKSDATPGEFMGADNAPAPSDDPIEGASADGGSGDADSCDCDCKCPDGTQSCSSGTRRRRSIVFEQIRRRRQSGSPCKCKCVCDESC